MDPHEARIERFRLVTAAHHFLIAALPLRDPQSRNALKQFVEHLERCRLPPPEVDAVLLRCLTVLDGSLADGPSLVKCYLEHQRADIRESPTWFRRCVEDLLRYRGVGNPDIRHAIALVEDRFRDPNLRQHAVATTVGLGTAEFAAKFKTWTGISFTEYLRNMRLDHAAALLIAGNQTIKEIWTEIGYNHPSNLDHDFKRRFRVTPSQYRALAIGSESAMEQLERRLPMKRRGSEGSKGTIRTVLIVDDDQGTRETIGRYLSLEGYRVLLASTGSDGLLEAARVSPQAILLDYHLPDIDGLTCLRTLRRNEKPTARATVVLFTADWELEVSTRELQELGAKLASKLCDLEEVQKLLAAP